MVGAFLEVLDFHRLFLKLNQGWLGQPPGGPS